MKVQFIDDNDNIFATIFDLELIKLQREPGTIEISNNKIISDGIVVDNIRLKNTHAEISIETKNMNLFDVLVKLTT